MIATEKKSTLYWVVESDSDCATLPSTGNLREWNVVTCASLEAYLKSTTSASSHRDPVLLDLPCRGTANLQHLKTLLQNRPEATVIVVTNDSSVSTAVSAIRLGAADFLPRPHTMEELHRALNMLHRPQASSTQTWRIDPAERLPGLATLTRCERHVLDCMLSAMTTKQISSAMHVGLQTIAKHKQRVLRKLGARNDVDLVLQFVGGDAPLRMMAASHSE